MKVTLSTLKSFLKNNQGKLWFQEHSRFDGMCDMVTPTNMPEFKPLTGTYTPDDKSQLGFSGIWCVRGSRDWFTHQEITNNQGTFKGIHCSNACGSWTVAVKSE